MIRIVDHGIDSHYFFCTKIFIVSNRVRPSISLFDDNFLEDDDVFDGRHCNRLRFVK